MRPHGSIHGVTEMKKRNEAAVSSNVVPISKDIGKKQEVEEYTPTEERFGSWLAHMELVFGEHSQDSFDPESCYQKGDFPRDLPLDEDYEDVVYEVPRETVDALLLKDIITSSFCRTHANEFLEKSFKKYDAIYKAAHKKWLRYLVNECHQRGLLELGEGK